MTEIESDLEPDVDSGRIVARGYHEQGERRVEYKYDLNGDVITVTFNYFQDGDQFHSHQTAFGVDNGSVVGGTWSGLAVEEFIVNHFEADPEAELGEIYEDVLEQQS